LLGIAVELETRSVLSLRRPHAFDAGDHSLAFLRR
jgi:hypothetical protein